MVVDYVILLILRNVFNIKVFLYRQFWCYLLFWCQDLRLKQVFVHDQAKLLFAGIRDHLLPFCLRRLNTVDVIFIYWNGFW